MASFFLFKYAIKSEESMIMESNYSDRMELNNVSDIQIRLMFSGLIAY